MKPQRLLFTLAVLAVSLTCMHAWREPVKATGTRVVYIVNDLDDEDMLTFLSAAAAVDPPPVVLLDTPRADPHLKRLIETYRPDRVVPVGPASDGEKRLGV